MQVIWNEKDLIPGMKLGSPRHKERFLLGYTFGGADRVTRKVVLVSLADGSVTAYENNEDLLEELNDGRYVPLEMLELPTLRDLWGNNEK